MPDLGLVFVVYSTAGQGEGIKTTTPGLQKEANPLESTASKENKRAGWHSTIRTKTHVLSCTYCRSSGHCGDLCLVPAFLFKLGAGVLGDPELGSQV